MPEAFDPYRKWLGILPKDQPPNHYRLLGIELFDDDSDVIEAAADQRMAHVRTYQTGQNSALSQKVLNELSTAKLCLLDEKKKAAYDLKLRGELSARISAATPDVAAENRAELVPLTEFDAVMSSIEKDASTPRLPAARGKRRQRPAWQISAAVAGGAVLVVVPIFWLVGRRPREETQNVVPSRSVSGNLKTSQSKRSVATGTRSSDEDAVVPRGDAAEVKSEPVNSTFPQPVIAAPPDREIAEEVLRRGGQLRLLANGQSIEVNMASALPGSEFEILDVRLIHAKPNQVADLAFLAKATRLELLSLWDSRITAASLIPLAGHPSLKHLNLEDTRLPTGSLKAILPLPALQTLLLANCQITEGDLNDLGALKRLRVLGLQGAPLNDGAMRTLSELPELRELILHAVPITDMGLATLITAAPQLQSLVVATTKITDDGLAHLQMLKGLKQLDIAHNPQLTGSGLEALKELPELEWLKLEKTNIGDDSLETLAQLPAIKALLLSNNRVTDSGLTRLSSLKALEYLELNHTQVTAAGIAGLKKALPNCRVVFSGPPAANSVALVQQPPPVSASIASPKFSSTSTGGRKLPVPEKDAVNEAERELRQRLKSQWSGGKDAAARLRAARALVGEANDAALETTERFVILSQAGDLYAAAADYSGAAGIIDLLAEQFDISPLALKAEALIRVNRAAKQAEQKQALVDDAIRLIAKAIDEDDYSVAEQLVKFAATAVRSANDRDRSEILKQAAKDVAVLSREYQHTKPAVEQLRKDPGNAQANLVVGKFNCEFKRAWAEGLPRLALGGDPSLSDLAKKDAASPVDTAAKRELGEQWLRVAEDASADARSAFQARALYWLEAARPGYKAVDRELIDKQMADVESASSYRARPLRWRERLAIGIDHRDELDCSTVAHRFELNRGFGFGSSWVLALEFNVPDFRSTGQFFFIGDDRGGRDALFVGLMDNPRLSVLIADTETNESHGLHYSFTKEDAGNWKHLRVIYDESTRGALVELDNKRIAEAVLPFNPRMDIPMPIWIGGSNASDQRFLGKVRRISLRNF